MRFSDIIGRKQIVDNLRSMVDSNRMPHALLFVEQPGCGALAMALATASYLFCHNRKKGDSCGVCPQCIKTDKLVHLDMHYIFPINTSTVVGKDKREEIDAFYPLWKEQVLENPYFNEYDLYKKLGIENKFGTISVSEANAIIRKLSLSSYEGGDKIMFIMFAERMNQEAANKLLKSLEEPSHGTYYFLISHSPSKILPTILSRCRIIEVPPVEKELLAERIESDSGLSHSDALSIAEASAGSYGKARELVETGAGNDEIFNTFITLLSLSVQKDMVSLFDIWNLLSGWGKEQQKIFCTEGIAILRKIYMIKLGLENLAYLCGGERDKLVRLSQLLKEDVYLKGYEYLNSAVDQIERNVNAKFVFCDLCNRFYYIA